MKIRRIAFEQFRNLAPGELIADEGINVLYGDNAQGKTNLLEAMWLFTGAKSFRGAKESSLIQKGESFARLEMDFFAQGRDQNATLLLQKGRQASLNGVKLKNGGQLAGTFRAVVFSPAHLTLVKDGPGERRRFLDVAICQLWPKYMAVYQSYLRAVTQRNALLKDARFHSQLYDMLEVYETEIACKGARIVAYRKRYLDRLCPFAQEIYSGIAGGKERLSLAYEGTPDGEEPERLLTALKAARREDMAAGVTSVGPHRDDLALSVEELDARQFASQGQQRSVVLALKLAEAAVLREVAGEQPVALLDDVMSELDGFRQDYILNHIRDWQVFLTGCDRAAIGRMTTGAVFRVANGQLTKEG